MCLIGVKETYVQEKKKVTKNFLGQICTTVSGLNMMIITTVLYISIWMNPAAESTFLLI